MTGFDFEALARAAREQVQPGEPPMETIRTRRRPRTWPVVTAAAAAVAVVIGLLVATRWSGDNGAPFEPAFPAPAGTRWVGAGSVVLAVPTSWADSQYGCESDPQPAVVYDVGYWTSCQDTTLGRDRQPSALWILPTKHARRGYGGAAYLKAHIDVPGLGGRRSEPWHEGGDVGGYWYQSLVVPSAHTIFVAQATSRPLVEQLIASARRTPPGVTVPASTAGSDLTAARALLDGYVVHLRRVAGYYRAGSVIGSAPAFGTPLPPGSSIALTVSTGLGRRQAMTDQQLAHQGLHIEPLGAISANDRQRADRTRTHLEAALTQHPSPWDTQILLRRITSTYPSRHGVPEIQHRLTWITLTPRTLVQPMGGPCCGRVSPPAGLGHDISVYDALTGHFEWEVSY